MKEKIKENLKEDLKEKEGMQFQKSSSILTPQISLPQTKSDFLENLKITLWLIKWIGFWFLVLFLCGSPFF